MRNTFALIVATLCLFLSSCHRPVAYFQPTTHSPAARLPVDKPVPSTASISPDVSSVASQPDDTIPEVTAVAVASLTTEPVDTRIERRMQRAQSMLTTQAQSTDKQPEPKPKKKLKLGNQIRQGLGMKLRPELNWWQRISWKLKASIIVILVAVVFAILHVTILAIIFGIVGAFLMISGLKRSFKVKRPWF